MYVNVLKIFFYLLLLLFSDHLSLKPIFSVKLQANVGELQSNSLNMSHND